jgi:putative ABC transport system permease protein
MYFVPRPPALYCLNIEWHSAQSYSLTIVDLALSAGRRKRAPASLNRTAFAIHGKCSQRFAVAFLVLLELEMGQDIRNAVRNLVRYPGFALTSILTLALAVGMATSIFTVVHALLLRPLPYPDASRLARIWTLSRDDNRGPVAFDDFGDWLHNSKTLESGAAFTTFYHPILSEPGHAERLSSLYVTHGYFQTMRVKPLLGRFFLAPEDRDGRDYVVVLAYDFWRNHFHADPRVVGRSILLNAHPHTIVGVAGPDLQPLPPQLQEVPPQIYRPVGEPFSSGSRDGRHLETLVRLRPDASIAAAQSELDVRCRYMQRAYKADAHLAARIVTLRDDITHSMRAPLLALQAAVLVLVLIACANIANLLLARSSARQKELAIRAALGAGRARLGRMLLTESLALGIGGCAGGLFLASWSTAGLTAVAAAAVPGARAISMHLPVLFFSFAVSLAASVLFGVAPVLSLDSAAPEEILRSGTRISGDRRNALRHFLVAAQVALALVLLVSAGLLGKSFLRLRSVTPGFDPRGVLAASVALPQAKYPKDAAVVRFFARALAKIAAIPGVETASAVSVVPMSGDFDTTYFTILGRIPRDADEQGPDRYIVTPRYFQTLRIPLRQGRLFDARDDENHPFVCIINETAARTWFPGESPLGQKIRAGSVSGPLKDWPLREIVGVVSDVAQYGLGLPHTPQIYMPHAQYAARYMTFMVRTSGDPAALASSVRKAVFGIDPEQPAYDVKPFESIVSNTIAARRLGLWLIVVFAVAALSLAAVGIYGVVSYSVAQRTAEFGIRLALGAQPNNIVVTALRASTPMIAAGLMIGILVALGASKLLARFLFSVSATDAFTFAALPVFLASVALAASYLPARRAASVDASVALRQE